MDYLPGQSVAIESPSRPKLWRYYSMATAPQAAIGLLEFHIRLIDGGAVSMALTSSKIADTKLSGWDLPSGAHAGGIRSRTSCLSQKHGPALLKAMLEVLPARPVPPKVQLFFGARTADELYDLDSLEKMAAQHPWPTVTSPRQPIPGSPVRTATSRTWWPGTAQRDLLVRAGLPGGSTRWSRTSVPG